MTGGFNVSVMMAASAVALKAQHGGLTLHDVDDLRTKAEELLAKDDPFRPAVMTFATMYEQNRRNPAALAELGADLWRAVHYITAPPPPATRERKDIDG